MTVPTAPPLRLAEVVGGLSVVSDLGKGLVDGQGLAACVRAMRLAERLGLPAAEREATFWVGLLRFVGCTATASEMAAALGDELAVSAAFAALDTKDLREVLRGAVAAVGARPDRIVAFLAKAPRVIREHEVTSCEVAQLLAGQLGLPATVSDALGAVFERWDGKGHPGTRAGEQLPRPARVWQVAHIAELLAQHDGPDEVAAGLRHRAGGALDPDIAAACADSPELCTAAAAPPGLAEVLAAEPTPHREIPPEGLDDVLAVFGLLADLKAPCFLGHSPRVAALAAGAAEVAGCTAAEVTAVRRAGLVHDVGRVAVSARIWGRPGPLSDGEREQVQLHPYYTQRVLARVPALAGLVELAVSHHERLDGSGYHRGLSGPALSPLAALLAAADCYITAGEPRPHRDPAAEPQRVQLLRDTALPADAVTAVLAAAGQLPRPVLREPARLTERERAVLGLVARGLTNRAAGRRLGISPKTVNAHLEHAYAKLGVSTRAAAVVAATQRGWLLLDGSDQPG